MLANDLANKLRDLDLTGSPDIRVAFLAADTEIGVVVKSPLDGLKTSPEMPRYVTGSMQIIVRHKDALQGDALAREVIDKLTVLGEPMVLETYSLKKFWPTAEPIMFPLNEAALFEFSCNFDLRAVRL